MANLKSTLLRTLWQKLYRLYAIRDNVIIGNNVHIGIGSILWAPKRLTVGDDVYIGKSCTIEVDGMIGDDVLIANHVGIIGRWDHDYHAIGFPMSKTPWIGDENNQGEGRGKKIIIEVDVWIEYGAILLSGITVGRGAIIAAGSVITKDIAPYSIAAGVPAKVMGMRFSKDEIRQHEGRIR